ncbi:hypothetical protein, partial [Streptomyces sp. NPDC059009]|uniref:hypothetical protein n=1 Tax=Streptomyces sp. NPDC059009 TaxID=3346694 RepID=UPI003677370D
ARRVPLDRLFLEHRLEYDPEHPTAASPPQADPNSVLRRLAPRPDLPGVRAPMPARSVTHLHGRRIIQVNPLGFAWDLRAISEPYQNAEGDIVLNLTSAYEYHRWLLTGADPDAVPVALYLLWTE